MNIDTLFLLPPGFFGQSRREYCPECAEVWGLLAYYPSLKESLEVVFQEIDRPRKQLTLLLGEEHQNCPTLVLHEDSPCYPNCGIQISGGHSFIDNARDIGNYYAARYGTPYPRGS